jgi:membrane-associated phospholipid phosphatase
VSSDLERKAGRWRTWLLPSAAGLLPPPPPGNKSFQTRAELGDLLQRQAQRSDAQVAVARYWDPQGGIQAWSQALLDKIKATSTNPVVAARALALFHTAIADAAIATWHAKFIYNRPQPRQLNGNLRPISDVNPSLPSYPSEHAAIAAAAATVFKLLFPGQTVPVHGQQLTPDAAGLEAALSRLTAGANFQSDILPGLEIGLAVGALAVARANSDGSSAVWDVNVQPGRRFGPQYWVPTPPANAFPPLLPRAGTWKPWLLTSGDQFRPPIPPGLQGAFPSALFLQETQEVKDAVEQITPDETQIVLFWADNPGQSFTPSGHWAQIGAEQVLKAGLSTPRAARNMALLGTLLADAAIATWEAKYFYWLCRPITAIRTLAGQPFHNPNFMTVIPTPAFPSYTSGHSGFSGAAGALLDFLLPGGTVADAFGQPVSYSQAADQAALSRLLGGIHYRSDNDAGLALGRSIAELAIQRARTDGAQKG